MQIRNLRQQAKMIRQKEKAGTCFVENKKATQQEKKNTIRGNKPQGTGERRDNTKISQLDKTIQTKQDIPKLRKNILSVSRGECTNTRRTRKQKNLEQNMGTKRTWQKSRMNKQYGKRVRRPGRKTEGENTPRFTLNSTQINNISTHERLRMEMKQAYSNEWKKERPHWSKRTLKRNRTFNNYWSITMMWKILTVQMWEDI